MMMRDDIAEFLFGIKDWLNRSDTPIVQNTWWEYMGPLQFLRGDNDLCIGLAERENFHPVPYLAFYARVSIFDGVATLFSVNEFDEHGYIILHEERIRRYYMEINDSGVTRLVVETGDVSPPGLWYPYERSAGDPPGTEDGLWDDHFGTFGWIVKTDVEKAN
ncbi:DNA binding protein [Mycobacterium phage Hawkeye]|uniref:Uncharacterized protein n=1 Tax=Mycobacterium phage Hawkeye TaxID=1458711 RepID=X2KST6_9CAUD|nr:DNA binding protein [Mycobacterium phage Hawkeye]AHN84111.1 hypothetical protein PBI_HAWKEYE_100 [Mycobacterium phage Hawkeye]